MKHLSPNGALRSLRGLLFLSLAGSLALLTACGKQGVPASAGSAAAQQPAPSQQTLVDSDGQPVVETRETLGPDFDDAVTQAPRPDDQDGVASDVTDALVEVGAKVGYQLPDFNEKWGLTRSVYDKAVTFMDLHAREFSNQRYVAILDMNKHSSKRRFFLFDLVSGKMETHNVAHGSGSDPGATGYARYFSNAGNSDKTSIGAYKTVGTYVGKHGLQMRLDGLESTNDRALSRGIVLHGASYVSDGGHAGRSWGCPAVDPRAIKSLISRLKGGALFLIWK